MNFATTRLLAIVMLVGALAAPSGAQQPAAKEGVWRFVDGTTVAMVRLDVTAYDRKAFEQWVADVVKANVKDARTVEMVTRGLRDTPVLAYPERLKEAGAKEAYGLFSFGDIPNSVGCLVVPVPPGADAERIARACFFLPVAKPAQEAGAGPLVLRDGKYFAAVVGDAVIMSAGSPERYTNFASADRPDLAAALKGAGDAPLTAAFSPNEDTRKVIEQMMPQLPPPASVPSTVLTRGLRYANAAVTLPPQVKLSAVVQASDAAAADALRGLVDHLLDIPRKDRGFHQAFPMADQMIAAVTPKVEGDRLVLKLEPADVDRFAGLIAGGLTVARERAERMHSLSNLKQIGLGVMMYRNDHKGAYPDTLGQTVQYFGDRKAFDQLMVNPQHPDRKEGYVYVKPAGDPQNTGPGTVIAYDAFDQWPGSVSVLFADGHAEVVSDQKRFDQLMAKTKEAK